MFEIIRYLLRRKMRTSLTIGAVAVGIFAVTAVGGIAEQMESIVQEATADALSRIIIWPKELNHPVTEATLRQLRRVEGVAGVTVTISDLIEELEEGGIVILVNPETFSGTRSDVPELEYETSVGTELWKGELPAPGSRTETVISWDLAQTYGLEVGDLFTIRERAFRVAGIWEYVAAAALRHANISYDMAQELATPNPFLGIGQVAVIPRPGTDAEQLAHRIEREVDGVEALSPQEAVRQARQQVLIFSLVVGASGIMALLIGTFTIVNSMIVSVHERQREIGLKKALGAAHTHILAEVVAEAAFIGGMGGLTGVLFGLATTWLANHALIDDLGMRLFLITPRLAIGAIVFTVLMGILAGVYPAWQAARLDPVVALRGSGGSGHAARGLRGLIALLRRNARSILTTGGIAIGIFALVVLGSLSEYLNGFLNAGLAGSADKIGLVAGEGTPFGRSTARIVNRVPGVQDVVLAGGGEAIEEGRSQLDAGGRFYGIESPSGRYGFEMPMDVAFAQGRNLTPGSLDEVVVGADLAEYFDLGLGSTLTIRDREFVVVGIWERIPQDISEFNSLAYISLDALELVLKQPDPISIMTALVEPGYDAEEVARAISDELPGIEAVTAEQYVKQIRQAFNILIGVMAGLLSIAVFVGSVSVVNTMVIAVHERTREIGLKKAVGAEDSSILAEVVADAGKLGGAGGLLGILAAWPVTLLINWYAQSAGGLTILSLTPRLAIGAIVFSILLGMGAGLLPAWRAAHLDPVVALRAE